MPVEFLVLMIFGSWILVESAPMPVLWSTKSFLPIAFWFLNYIMFMPVCDMFRWFVPIPIFEETDISILLPRLTPDKLDGSMFSFLFCCVWICDELLLLEPRLQMPFNIYFFCAMPELILLITLLTPPTLWRFELEGSPDPDLLGLSLDDLCPAPIILLMASSAVVESPPMFECDWFTITF